MIYKLLDYIQSNPIETKLMSLTTLGSIIAPMDVFLKYFLPLASALTWYFLKPVLDKWRKKRRKKEGEDGD